MDGRHRRLRRRPQNPAYRPTRPPPSCSGWLSWSLSWSFVRQCWSMLVDTGQRLTARRRPRVSRELLSAGAAVSALSAAGLPGDGLQPVAVALPPTLVARRQVVVAVEEAGGSVDELANDVGVPSVPVRLGDRVHQQAV